jgi:hypothetical protein
LVAPGLIADCSISHLTVVQGDAVWKANVIKEAMVEAESIRNTAA